MKVKIGIIILLSIFSLSLFGQNWDAVGLTPGESYYERGQEVFVLADADGFQITYTVEGELTGDQVQLIGRYAAEFLSWKTMEVKTLHFQVSAARIAILIIPVSFQSGGENFLDSLPAGLQFFHTRFLEYSFRMEKDHLFMQLRGQFLSEDNLVSEVFTALADPARYIQIHDPDYFVEQVHMLQASVSMLETTVSQQATAISQLEQDLSSEKERASAAEESLSSQLAEAETSFNTKLSEMSDTVSDLTKEFQKARYAIVGINNRNFFNIIKDFDSSLIDKIVEEKEANPGADVDTVLANIKAAGVSGVDKALVSLVFMAFYNEFE